MKKRGLLAFIIYLLGCLFAVGALVEAYIEAQNIPEPDVDNFGALGVGLLIIFAMIIGIPSAIRLVLKFVHMLSGWKLFGVLCIILDVLFALYLAEVHNIFIKGFEYWVSNSLILLPGVLLLHAPSIISNLRSIKE